MIKYTMANSIIGVTQQKCPENQGGGRHHMIPSYTTGHLVMKCLTCHKTEAELEEETTQK